MATHSNRLPIPPSAKEDPKAVEALSVWVSGGNQHVSLNPRIWDDPAIWGLMLVDLARHVANAYSQAGEQESSDVLNRIRQGFDAEWQSPTDAPRGGLMDN
jgi:hypothetical protein